ncbi:nuclear transport factor 2 family protein [Roseitranquillus sediminis]|uniref:nuclear transport factor 2 family protein n=1 Tax=Roseitranquillus sediminis TaxID=2809051 RepID=UPI001D0CD3D5|nr:nuclear transport factor 2 family protein [Roseitranquillus sediminis]MBM9593873.1 nuclear transport factor 2 family protein [Roseitranquillus sediminis]
MDPSTDDYIAIMQLYARYARAIDSGDGEGWANCYATDGQYLSSTFGECNGRSELAEFAADHYRRWLDQGIQTRHWNNQVLLTDNGDGTITGSVYVLLAGVKAGEAPALHLQTVYTDTLVREAGRWVLRQRRSDADQRPDPSQLGFKRWDTGEGIRE